MLCREKKSASEKADEGLLILKIVRIQQKRKNALVWIWFECVQPQRFMCWNGSLLLSVVVFKTWNL
jgi:hypothetical protein